MPKYIDDLISRHDAINLIERMKSYCLEPDDIMEMIDHMPSAQPERLTDDDLETIRIHLSAHIEDLCNQRRWKEAEEYQRIIDRFMALASAPPKGWLEQNKDKILQAGMEGREIDIRIGGRLFAIREKAQ